MHYPIPQCDEKDFNSFGSPILRFSNYCDEQYQQHPRTTHSHHELVEILYILRSEGTYKINGTICPIHTGDIVIYNSDVVHNECVQTPPPPVYGLEISGIQLPDLPSNWLLPLGASPVIATGERSAEFRRMFTLIYENAYRQTHSSAVTCQLLLQALLNMIAELISSGGASAPKQDSPSKATALGRQMQIYIDEHALESLSVQSISEHFEISQTYASRVFKKATGTSLMQYIIQRKIGEAQTLLLLTDYPITDIAKLVGYDNLSHFIKMFTQNVGLSPRKYRKQSGLPSARGE